MDWFLDNLLRIIAGIIFLLENLTSFCEYPKLCTWLHDLGMPYTSKTDYFRKSSDGGRGVIFNLKIYIEDFCHYRRYFGHEFRKKLQYDFPKMRGRSKAVWNFSENSSVLELLGFP